MLRPIHALLLCFLPLGSWPLALILLCIPPLIALLLMLVCLLAVGVGRAAVLFVRLPLSGRQKEHQRAVAVLLPRTGQQKIERVGHGACRRQRGEGDEHGTENVATPRPDSVSTARGPASAHGLHTGYTPGACSPWCHRSKPDGLRSSGTTRWH